MNSCSREFIISGMVATLGLITLAMATPGFGTPRRLSPAGTYKEMVEDDTRESPPLDWPFGQVHHLSHN
jgi:hypothetical protein